MPLNLKKMDASVIRDAAAETDDPGRAELRGAIGTGYRDKSFRDYGGGPDKSAAENDGAIDAALADIDAGLIDHIYLPQGDFLTSKGFYDILKGRWHGPGRLILGGYAQARERRFITSEVADYDADRTKIFDGDWPGHSQQYTFVGPNVGSTPITVDGYRNLYRASGSVRIFDTVGGGNFVTDSNRRRTGIHDELCFLYQGGQGDCVSRSIVASMYSPQLDGMTHFLAGPNITIDNGALGADSSAGDGGYIQHSEFIISDGGRAMAVTDRVRNFFRNNNDDSMSQWWTVDRFQSAGSFPLDTIFSMAGGFRRGFDPAAGDFGDDGAVLPLHAGQYVYFNGVAHSDALGLVRYTDQLGDTRLGHDGDNLVMQLADGENFIVEDTSGNELFAVQPDGIRVAGETISPVQWTAPALLNSWAERTEEGQVPVGYRIGPDGRVHLRGGIVGGDIYTTIFTLPEGFRPAGRQYFSAFCSSGMTAVTIDAGGTVFAYQVADDGTNKNVGLDGVSFERA